MTTPHETPRKHHHKHHHTHIPVALAHALSGIFPPALLPVYKCWDPAVRPPGRSPNSPPNTTLECGPHFDIAVMNISLRKGRHTDTTNFIRASLQSARKGVIVHVSQTYIRDVRTHRLLFDAHPPTAVVTPVSENPHAVHNRRCHLVWRMDSDNNPPAPGGITQHIFMDII